MLHNCFSLHNFVDHEIVDRLALIEFGRIWNRVIDKLEFTLVYFRFFLKKNSILS